jgi:hypothetical protein
VKFTPRGGPYLCDTGPNLGLYRYDGALYLTAEEDAQLSGELATAAGVPAVGPGRFELHAAGDVVVLTCTRCGGYVRGDRDLGIEDDDLTTLVADAAAHECRDLAAGLNARLDQVGDAIKAQGGQR